MRHTRPTLRTGRIFVAGLRRHVAKYLSPLLLSSATRPLTGVVISASVVMFCPARSDLLRPIRSSQMGLQGQRVLTCAEGSSNLESSLN